MRILVMGGTKFIGRHFVIAAERRGHSVTLFHRGRHSTTLFPDAEQVIGDRDRDLGLLADGTWDTTVDFSAYVPRQVRQIGAALGERSGRYVLLSSTAVYAPPQRYGFREDAPLVALSDPTTEDMTDETYGGLKALCERAASETFSDPLIVRPTYVVGPLDYTGRFTWWVQRIARGGEVLAPGPQDALFQLIDVRDLTEWLVRMLEAGSGGTYHLAHPFPPVSFGTMLADIVGVVGRNDTTLTWVDREFLLAAGVDGTSLPLWPGAGPDGVLEAADPARAIGVGLVTRSLPETIRDLYQHECASPTPVPEPVGMTPEAETELLQRWRARPHR
ncbi:NAD-dependent epimerase/dehydratase family protein [Micromonospora sp. NPDC049903]|uniref:NAD-dependent epimerase/dehydratase family protein n=1 Tax=Micromonospora sp. NPDC049903 TaxID=3364276 RepID=UPI00378D871F